jgi:hypothetical protein
MTDAGSQEIRFSTLETAELVQYQKVSLLAVVSLVLGILSPTAFAHPLLWIVPLIAAGLAIWSLRVIAASNSALVGRRIAIAALALAMLFGAWAPSRHYSRQVVLSRHGQQFVQHWVELVRNGRLYEAYELHLPPEQRHSGQSLEDIYEDRDADSSAPSNDHEAILVDDRSMRRDFRRFFADSPLPSIMDARQQGTLQFSGTESLSHNASSRSDEIVFLYTYTAKDQPALPLRISLTRSFPAASTDAQWSLKRIEVERPGG